MNLIEDAIMKTLENEEDKIQKISSQLRHQVLEPAHEEAKKIIEDAKKKAAQINSRAEKEAEDLIKASRKTIEQDRNVFYSSLQQASKQVIEALRLAIEQNLFNPALQKTLSQTTSNPQIIADLIKAIIKSIEIEGLSADLQAIIPKAVSARDVNALLTEQILKKLKEQSVVLGDLTGGVKVKYANENLTIDVSDETLRDLISRYVRKDFRKLIFGTAGSS